MSETGRRRQGGAALRPEDLPADGGTGPQAPRAPRLALGAAIAIPVALVVALVVALSLGRESAGGGGLATAPASRVPSVSVPSTGGGATRPPTFSQVAASGGTRVAVGVQAPATPSFRVSTDGGRTWTPAATHSEAGPVDGHQATTVAGGPGGWAALGPHAIWTSADGTAWTLVSASGLAASGETITAVTKDSWGYLATGTSARSKTGLVWTSTNGQSWHKATAAQFGLVNAPDERVFAMTHAASDWNLTLVSGSATKDGKTCAYIWLTLDKGVSWRTVVVPQDHGAGWSFAGLAGDAGHFIAVRPGIAPGGLPEAVVYASADAVNWHYAATVAGTSGFTPQQVTAAPGSPGRFVMTGRDRQGHTVAYAGLSSGATWTQGSDADVIPSA